MENVFILCFLTIIWKKIFISALYYSELKGVPITGHVLLKSIKYHLFSPLGILREIKPYLERALKIGFLMPNESKKHKDVFEAIQLFGEAYRNGEKSKKKFLLEHSPDFNYEEEISKISKEEFLEMMEIWDMDIRLIPNEDQILELLEISLFSILSD